MTDRAVVMTVSADRPDYLRQTLASWAGVDGRDSWAFGFAIEPDGQTDSCFRMIKSWLGDREGFILINDERLGVLRNPHALLNEGFASYRYVVLAEEDVLVSSDVLRFFEFADRLCEPDPQILLACATSWDAPGLDPGDYQVWPHFAPLVWGTWRDRWAMFLRDTWDLDYTSGGPDGFEAGWDWNIFRIMQKHDLCALWPRVSRSLHIGAHGAHADSSNFPNTQAASFVASHMVDYWRDKRAA